MIISDLQHLEVVEETSLVIGGTNYHPKKGERKVKRYKGYEVKLPAIAVADAESNALAVGRITATNTSTETQAVAGLFSKSNSNSSSLAVGTPE